MCVCVLILYVLRSSTGSSTGVYQLSRCHRLYSEAIHPGAKTAAVNHGGWLLHACTVELLPHWQHSRSTTCLQRHVAHEHVWIATQQVHCILNPCNKSGFIDASQGHYRFSETEHFQPCVVYDTRCIPAKQHICKAATCQRQPDFEGPASACTRPSAKMPDGLSTLPQAALELQIWLQQYPLSNSLRTPNQPMANIQPACP